MEYISVSLGLLRLLYDLNSPAAVPPNLIIQQWLYGKGTYVIHQDITEREACSRAESRAKLDALRQFGGEYMGAQSLVACEETNDGVNCPMQNITWTTVNGLISRIRNKTVRAGETLEGHRTCRVVLEAQISLRPEAPDPGFDIQVKLSSDIFREGDPITISLDPSQPMYVNLLMEDANHDIHKVFPNQYDTNFYIASRTTVPATKGYKILAAYAPNITSPTSYEILHVLATPQKLFLSDTYDPETLALKVLEIPNNQKRYTRHTYKLIRRTQ